MNNTQTSDQWRWLYVGGAILNVAYLATLGYYVFIKWQAICALPANELGDFLAGAFSPMAFAWLVLGFIQQGFELRQNSAALILQAEELRNAAMHAGDMVELQRKEFELRIKELEEARTKAQAAAKESEKRREAMAVEKAQPRFTFELLHREIERKTHAVGKLSNHGKSCTKVRIEMEPIPKTLSLLSTCDFEQFDSELSVTIRVFSANDEHTHPLTVHYTDALGNQRHQNFIVSPQKNFVAIVEKRIED